MRVAEFGSGAEGFSHDWSPDGKYCCCRAASSRVASWFDCLLADRRWESMGPSAATEGGDARLSTDGRWVAYLSSETGSTEVHVQELS